MRPLLAISFLLAFLGGYADAASFVLVGSFTGHLTGNTVLTAVHLSGGAWTLAATNALAVVGFAVGTAWGDGLVIRAQDPTGAGALRVPLWLQGGCLVAGIGCLWPHAHLLTSVGVVCLCVGMGIQNGALQKCGAVGMHTTFITGMSTSLLGTVVQQEVGRQAPDAKHKQSAAILTGIIAVFVCGALAGGFLSQRFQVAGLAGVLAPWAIALLLACVSWEDDAPHQESR